MHGTRGTLGDTANPWKPSHARAVFDPVTTEHRIEGMPLIEPSPQGRTARTPGASHGIGHARLVENQWETDSCRTDNSRRAMPRSKHRTPPELFACPFIQQVSERVNDPE